MDLNKIKVEALEKLCYKDPRSPYYWKDPYSEELPEPRKNCACDNCFYGRDKMALTILALLEHIPQKT